MISRKLLGALVGISLGAGMLGTASAQTASPANTQAAAPSETTTPVTAAPSATTTKKAPVKHRVRMTKKTHRKHVSQRATAQVAAKHTARKHLAGKRMRFSHLVKRDTAKHV